MQPGFIILALLLVGGALGAMFMRNLVHCALCLAVTFAGLAALYLQLDAEFVGFTQILVYIGAVAMLIVFAILLTRNSDAQPRFHSFGSAWIGAAVAIVVAGSLIASVFSSAVILHSASGRRALTVKQIGVQLMGHYVLPLEVIGLLLTAALIGAVIIAMPEKKPEKKSTPPHR